MTTIKTTLTLLATMALAACASTADSQSQVRGVAAYEGDPRLGQQVDRACFNRAVDSFYNNTRDTVVVSCGGSNDYLVEVVGNCLNLRNAQSVGIDSTLGHLQAGDYMIVSESAFSLSDSGGIGPQRCGIKSIHAWDKRAKA